MSQVELGRRHLTAGNSITPASAIAVYGIFRLSSVIEDLRNSGMEIDCVLKHDEIKVNGRHVYEPMFGIARNQSWLYGVQR